jgi:hypothetical protein
MQTQTMPKWLPASLIVAAAIFGATVLAVPAAAHMQRCDQAFQFYMRYPSNSSQADYQHACN